MRFFAKLLKSEGFKQSIILTFGNGFSTGISAISLILISRFLGPAEFGVFSVAFSLTTLLSRLFDFGLNVSLQKYVAQTFEHSSQQANHLLSFAIRVKLVLALFLIGISFPLAPLLAHTVFKGPSPELIRLSIILTGVVMIYEFLTYLYQAIRSFGKSVLLTAVQASTKLVTTLTIMLMGIVDSGIVYPLYALGPVTAIIVGMLLLPKWFDYVPSISPQNRTLLLNMTKFTAIATTAAAVGDHIDVLMVNNFLDEYATGLFAAASRVSLLMAIVAFSVGSVLNSRVARYHSKEHMQKYVVKSLGFIVACLILIPVILPFSKLFMLVTAGPDYLSAVPTLQLLLVSGVLVLMTAPLVAIFFALENPEYFALSGIIQTIVLISLNAVMIPAFGILGAGWARVLTRAVVFLFTLAYAFVILKKRFKLELKSYYNLARKVSKKSL